MINYRKHTTTAGDVWLHPLREDEIHVTSEAYGLRSERDSDERYLHLRINRVEYRIRGWVKLVDGKWQVHERLTLTRVSGYQEPSDAAMRKARQVMEGIAAALNAGDVSQDLNQQLRVAGYQDCDREVARREAAIKELRAQMLTLEKEMEELSARRAALSTCGCDVLNYPPGFRCEHDRA